MIDFEKDKEVPDFQGDLEQVGELLKKAQGFNQEIAEMEADLQVLKQKEERIFRCEIPELLAIHGLSEITTRS